MPRHLSEQIRRIEIERFPEQRESVPIARLHADHTGIP